MKEETKELIRWIATQISLASHLDQSYHIIKNAEVFHQQMENKAYDFLDSLTDIESHLCRGGYIQDKNGTPCCDGDKVKFNGYPHTLYWSKNDSRFYLKDIEGHCLQFSKLKIEKIK